ncbi:MAG: hypothetical protein OEZ36_11075 [Spirochaetota bacterium]|nr:hypothetical protein [Spirochaetota bacterium]
MDVTNQQIPSLRGMANNYLNLNGRDNVLKQSNLRKNLHQLRQNLNANSAKSSFEASTRIALAESYISKGNFFAAEQVIKEVSDMAFSYMKNTKDDSYDHEDLALKTVMEPVRDQETATTESGEKTLEIRALETIKAHMEEESKKLEASQDHLTVARDKDNPQSVPGLNQEVQDILAELKDILKDSKRV